MNKSLTYLIFCVGILLSACSEQKFFLVDGDRQAVIVIQDDEENYLKKAVQDLVSDIQKIGGKEILVTDRLVSDVPNVVIGTLGKSDLLQGEFSAIDNKWECYALRTNGRDLTIAGSSARGTMFGVYYFIENYLGVDPMYWWKDVAPETRTNLVFGAIDYTSKEPDFKFRGWFINDEDLLTEWKGGGGKRDLDYRYYHQVVHPEIASRIFESAVRARFNLMIPASFIEIFNPREEKLVQLASERGLFLSQHHIEPLGVSAFGYFNYWKNKTGEKPLFSYYSEKEKVVEVWRESAKRWSKYPDIIWQIGLRGIADRPMWLADPGVPQTDTERAGIISDAMQTQMDILNELIPEETKEVTTTLWGEGAVFNEMGLLKFPKNTTIIFADNSPGWIMQEDFYETKREPEINYGIYYHHGLIGPGPHLAQGVPPSKTAEIFKLAREMESDYYAIMNVGNVREFALGIEASRDMLEEIDEYDPEKWLKEWCAKNFPSDPKGAYEAYKTYFSSYVEDDVHGTPLLLDGLSRGKANNNTSFIKRVLKEGLNMKKKKGWLEGDAFRKSLEKAHPGGQMNREQWLAKAQKQDEVLALAMTLAEEAFEKMEGQEKQFFNTNLIAHIKFMQCLTGWVVETTQAAIAMQELNKELAVEHLKSALKKFDLYEEAIAIGSKGKYERYYTGEKKIDVKNVKRQTESALAMFE